MVCTDEQPVQLIRKTREAPPATTQQPDRVDYEDERAGGATAFVLCGALGGWREASARERCTKTDCAREVATLKERRYADREKVTLVLDNLHTDIKGASCTASEATRARKLVRRIKSCTPKHGSWLNIAESELSEMTRQCLCGRRIGVLEALRAEIAALS
ncbi:MAG: transposase [Bryobacterales bacterium]|nr:transposase [Bryobacterales bacterium]